MTTTRNELSPKTLRARIRRIRSIRSDEVPLVRAGMLLALGLLLATVTGDLVNVRTREIEPAIRTGGGALQLIGFVYVVLGLAGRVRSFDVPISVQQLRKELALIAGKPRHYHMAAGSASVVIKAPRITAHGKVSRPDATLGERVAIIEEKLLAAQKALDDLWDASDREREQREQADDAEKQQRIEADESIRKTIRDLQVGDIHLEWVGVVWIIVGTITSTWSEELARLWGAIV